MKSLLNISLFLVLLCISVQVVAEKDNPPAIGTISGVVVDSATGEPMPYVNVVVRDPRDSIITGGITDDRGRFLIKQIPEGNSNIEIQFIGYAPIVKKIDISQENRDVEFQNLVLSENTQQLEEVTIRGEVSTVTQKIDRKVINVGKDLTATGTNASELLNNVQSVSVDQQTGEVSLRGNENVRVFIDGKPSNISPAQLLKQIPSSSIKSIELITNPSAKYSPEGMSGIINIVLYKNAQRGLNGSVQAGITAGENMRYNGSLDMNYSTGKINMYVNYGGRTGNRTGGGTLDRTDINVVSMTDYLNNSTSNLLKTGIDLFLNESNTLSFYTVQNLYDMDRTSTTLNTFQDIPGNDILQEMVSDNYSGIYNMNFKREFDDDGHSIEFEASFSTSDNIDDGLFTDRINPGDPTENYADEVVNEHQNTLVNLDYIKPFSDAGKLEMGLEYRQDGVRNNYDTNRQRYLFDEDNMRVPDGEGGYETVLLPDSRFTYKRQIYSAYTTYGHKIGDLSFQAGLRVEQYDIEALFSEGDGDEPYADSKLTAYPSAYVTYTPGQKSQYQVSYSRRVDRPGISQVNPIRAAWSSPLTTFVGNPELKPQFTHSVELNYSRRFGFGSLSFGTFYRRINDNIIRYTNPDPYDVNKTEVTYENADGENRAGVEVSGMIRPAKWWNMNVSSDLYYQQMSGYALGSYVEVQSLATNVRMNNMFKVTEDISLQLFGMYRGARRVVQYEFLPMYMVSAGFSWDLFDDNATVSFRVNDIFNTMKFQFESINYYPVTGSFYWESRTANLSFSYQFKSGEVKTRKRKQRDDHTMSGGEGF